MAIGDDSGDLAAGELRLPCRLSSWELETAVETLRLGIGDDTRGLAAGVWKRRWRLSGWGLKTTLEI